MASAKEYLSNIGSATERDIRFALSIFLFHRFWPRGTFKTAVCPAGKEAIFLAVGAAMNVILGDIDISDGAFQLKYLKRNPSNYFMKEIVGPRLVSEHVPPDTLQFAIDNARLMEAEIRQLSRDNRLCSVLSGAAYNIAYARYVRAGGSRGIFSNHFLTYVRTMFCDPRLLEFHLKQARKIEELGRDITKPLDGLVGYGLLCRFPANPDERAYYKAVRQFAEEMATLERAQEIEPAEITPAYRDRVASEYADGYPTKETVAEFLEAHQNGGKDAIKALLEKRRAALKQTDQSTSDA